MYEVQLSRLITACLIAEGPTVGIISRDRCGTLVPFIHFDDNVSVSDLTGHPSLTKSVRP